MEKRTAGRAACGERDEVLKAMRGHVLAAGELVRVHQHTIEPPK